MLFNDDLFDRLARRFRHSLPEGNGQHGPGLPKNLKNVVVNQSTFIERRDQIIQNFVAGTGLDPVLEPIIVSADLDALVDSTARFPPPTCHPGTRLKIGHRLLTWLDNPDREWNLIWLYGPAGTGKSAVSQTFAERCAEKGRLGASFFFSRSNDRNDPNTVIPTPVYQLAVQNLHYKSLVAAQLINDPGLMQKTRRTQFQKLVVEPLSDLQIQEQNRIREPLLVVLDGLDECKNENAQREFVELVSEVVRLKKDFPLVWLICSRPKPHLKYLFSGADFHVHFGREELANDAESIADVDFYIRDGLTGIKADFSDVTTTTWPPEEQIVELLKKASGHFGFASTSLRYIGDPTNSDPMSQLSGLLSFLGDFRAVPPNPLKVLDSLYTAIFDNVPKDVLPTTMQILGFFIFINLRFLDTVQGCCNFLHIDQATFYRAFQKLHSVVVIPLPGSASQSHLNFYHGSFEDYLVDSSRSGKFAIIEDDAYLSHAKLCLSWYKTDLELFHTTDGLIFNGSHNHGVLPGLSWVSDDNIEEISEKIATQAEFYCWDVVQFSPKWDEALLSQIRNFDFRYIQTLFLDNDWRCFLNDLWDYDSSSGIIRTKPHTEVDHRLLEYMKSMVGSLWCSTPATFPMKSGYNRGKYFFLGYGLAAVVCWANGHRWNWFSMLNADEPPLKERIEAFRVDFKNCEDSEDRWI